MKHFDREVFKENLINHELFIEALFEQDTEKIFQNITKMLQQSMDQMAPVIMVQVSNKNSDPLSQEAREALKKRELAQRKF